MNLKQIKKYITISPSNMKTGKIPSISLPPIVTCNPNAKCHKDCYVLKSYRLYPHVREAYQKNLNTFKTNPELYFQSISDWLTIKKPDYFRYHNSGDIPNLNYLNNIINIAKLHPKVKFLLFTKQYKFIKHFKDLPSNLSIVISAWPGMRLPKTTLPLAYMQDGTEKRVTNALECPGNCETCGMCWNLKSLNKNVVFKKH